MADEIRGKINFHSRKRQLIDASGLVYGKCSMTDMDCVFEFADRAAIWIEVKHRDAPMPAGQNVAYRHLCNAWCQTGRKGIVIEATHEIDDPDVEIPLHECIVRRVYYNRGWTYKVQGTTVKRLVDDFLIDAGIDLKTGRKK